MEADVAIVGSGPAGTTAAWSLAAGGLSTLLLDRAEPPRYKTCGGGVVRRAVSLLPVDPGPVTERHCTSAELREASGFHFVVHRGEPIVLMTMRAELDARMVEAARGRGVRTVFPCEVRELRQGPEFVELQTSAGEIRVRHLIAADGATGVLAHKAGWSAPLTTLPALEWEIEVSPATLERFDARALFDLGRPRGGYAWVFPKRDRLSVGMLCVERRGGLRQALARYVAELRLDGVRGVERHGFPIPVRPRAEGSARGRVLLVGDAAGFADPVTCEGISHAALSGRLAARAILEGGPGAAGVRAAYRRLLEAHVLPELRLARVLARLLYHRESLRARLFRRRGGPFVEAMTELICGARSYRELLADPRNWLRLLRGRGRWIDLGGGPVSRASR